MEAPIIITPVAVLTLWFIGRGIVLWWNDRG